MSAEDEIQIDLRSDTSEGERARKKLQEIEHAQRDLKSSFDAGNLSLARYKSELRDLTREAKVAQAALDRIHPPKLEGTKRASAKFQLGLAGANIAQDVIQGGPAAGVNNILGLAGNNSVRALGGEYLGAAGGLKVLTAGLGTFAAVAGAAFLVVDTGLRSAKLGWSDLDNVIANSGPVVAFSKGFQDLVNTVESSGLGEFFSNYVAGLTGAVGEVANLTIGWDKATAAARKEREEVEKGIQATREYVKAAGELGKVKSEAQKTASEKGTNTVQQIAELGGKGGLDAVLDRLADEETKFTAKHGNGSDKMVKVRKINEKGEDEGEEEISVREEARRRIASELAKAGRGDEDAAKSLKDKLGQSGYDISSITGRDPKKDMEKARKVQEDEEKAEQAQLEETYDQAQRQAAEKKRLEDARDKRLEKDRQVREAEEEAQADLAEGEKKDRKASLDKAEKATAGTAVSTRLDRSLLRNALKAGGLTPEAMREAANELSEELQSKGLSKDEADSAAQMMAKEHGDKLGEEVAERSLADPKRMEAPGRIASMDFAASVEGSGARDAQKLQGSVDAMKDKLSDLVRNVERGSRLVR